MCVCFCSSAIIWFSVENNERKTHNQIILLSLDDEIFSWWVCVCHRELDACVRKDFRMLRGWFTNTNSHSSHRHHLISFGKTTTTFEWNSLHFRRRFSNKSNYEFGRERKKKMQRVSATNIEERDWIKVALVPHKNEQCSWCIFTGKLRMYSIPWGFES